ncbi:MAG: hypothetical protein J6C45_03850 [Alistipes sp.]|nr:hypothetical protein [Alistipes sp.]
MTRSEIIRALRQFFDIDELVCNHTLAKWGDRAWQFLATDYLHALLIIRRDILRRPMYCNGFGKYQRGLRCNMCPLVGEKESVYLSSHILGQAGDFTVEGMTAEEARALIRANAHLLPCNIRMEKGVSWLHIDTLPQEGITAKVYEFAA